MLFCITANYTPKGAGRDERKPKHQPPHMAGLSRMGVAKRSAPT
jgi:hypothetical protein